MIDTKALREKILDLAIRGKLVPQDPNDEPASVLLERIRAQKQQMVKEGKLKAKDIKNDTIIFKGEDNLHYEQFQDGAVKCIEDEIPFEIPESWEWVRLGSIYEHNTGKALNSSNTDGVMLTYITTSNLYWDRFELDSIKEMPFTDSEIEKCTVKKGDLLVCEGGDVGRSAIWHFDNEIRIQNHIHRLRSYVPLANRFYYYVFYLWKMQERIGGQGIGLQGLSSRALHKILVPLPSTNEQKNIVDKLDCIFDCISDLDVQKEDFLLLVDIVKSKILDLAIRGKLVPQDPNDEPASVLLERIRAEKEELIKQGKIKRDKKESVIFKGEDNSYYQIIGKSVEECEDLPFDLPQGWQWTSLGQYSEKVTDQVASGSFASLRANVVSFKEPNYAIMVKTADFSNNFTKNLTYTDKHGYEFLENSNLFGGELILSNIGSIGKVFIVPYLKAKMTLAPNSVMVRLTNNEYRDYLYYFLQSPTGYEELKAISTGVAMLKFNKTDLKTIYLPVPPLAEQKRIVETIETIFTHLNEIANSIV